MYPKFHRIFKKLKTDINNIAEIMASPFSPKQSILINNTAKWIAKNKIEPTQLVYVMTTIK